MNGQKAGKNGGHTYLAVRLRPRAHAEERIDKRPGGPAHGGLRETKGLDGGAHRDAVIVREGGPECGVGEQGVDGGSVDVLFGACWVGRLGGVGGVFCRGVGIH